MLEVLCTEHLESNQCFKIKDKLIKSRCHGPTLIRQIDVEPDFFKKINILKCDLNLDK